MPGPGNKRRKAKSVAKASGNGNEDTNDVRQGTSIHTNFPPLQCLTLMEDGITRCGQRATEGDSKPEHCKVHHGQFCILYKKYKDASKVVNESKDNGELPTKSQIVAYTDRRAALEKARWVRSYLEAMRVEREGLDIHLKRFFLKVSDDHKNHIKMLEREMATAVDLLDALHTKAYELYRPVVDLYATNDRTLSRAEKWLENRSRETTEMLRKWIRDPDTFNEWTFLILPLMVPTMSVVGDEDLIDISLRERKERMMGLLGPWNKTGPGAMPEMGWIVCQQFARRIVFHEPTLFMKSLGRVSFNDLIYSDDFSMEDLARFVDLSMRRIEFPLTWFKDAVLDVLDMSRTATGLNTGSRGDRFPLLGGWVCNRPHTASLTNEGWWCLLQTIRPPANSENYFARLCNNFDDFIALLSFQALGHIPVPSFCNSPPHFYADDPGLSWRHLSLSGIVITDMFSPNPLTPWATLLAGLTDTRIEARAYMFGAVRNERDEFLEEFLRELRARPDLFQVVLRSETDPGRKVETFGSGPSNNEALPVLREHHRVEAPSLRSSGASRPGEWDVLWSAVDVLYGPSWEGMSGHLAVNRDHEGWFFRFKTFPVRYFVILDTVPDRNLSVLARNVAWAALRAGGYGRGEYTLGKYAAAADELLEKCARERLGWMPEGVKLEIKKMRDQI